MEIKDLKFKCKYFKGDMPCEPNKLYDVACNDCPHYEMSSDWEELISIKDSKENIIFKDNEIWKYVQNFSNSFFIVF